MDETLIFEDNLIFNQKITNNCIDRCLFKLILFDNFNYDIFLKIKPLDEFTIWHPMSYCNIYDLLIINKIFNLNYISGYEYIYIPLKLIHNMYTRNNKKIPSLEITNKNRKMLELDPELLYIKSNNKKKNRNISVNELYDDKHEGFCTGTPRNLYFLIIIVKDNNIQNNDGMCGIQFNDVLDKSTTIFLEDMEIKSVDVYYNNNQISGYYYIFNFTELSDDEFLEGYKNNNLEDDLEYKKIFRVRFLGDYSRYDTYLFLQK